MQNTREEMILLTIRDEVGLAIRYQSQLFQVGVGILTRKNSNKFVYKYYSKQLIYSYESQPDGNIFVAKSCVRACVGRALSKTSFFSEISPRPKCYIALIARVCVQSVNLS